MTDSLSKTTGTPGSSLRDPDSRTQKKEDSNQAFLKNLRIQKENTDDLTVDHQAVGSDYVSNDELTIISQPPSFSSQKEAVAAMEGKRVGHFELKQFLGGGGMGLVFRAYDAVLDRSVAIKLLPRDGTNSQTLLRFQVEARSAARLDHPNISRIFQVGSEEACDYIVFEYVEGDNLAQLVRRIGPLPLELGLRYTFQLALALQHAYQRNVVHRDVKPANVVVTDGGKLKLIDLGLARPPKTNESDDSLTAAGVTLGTYDYISPEQAKDSRNADVRSDLYSLGCTVFFMFTGRPPYPEGTPIEKIIQHSSEKRPNPNDYRSDLPHGFNQITSKLLAIEPADRYQRPAELIADIQEIASKNNLPLLGYDDNVIVKEIIQKPSWVMQLLPVLIPAILLLGFVFYFDWVDNRSTDRNGKADAKNGSQPNDGQLGTKPKSRSGNQSTNHDNKSSESGTAQSGKNESDTKSSKSSSGTGKSATIVSDTIYVGDPPAGEPGAKSYATLEAALEAIQNSAKLDTIKVNSDLLVLQQPVSVNLQRELTITSANSRTPLVVFRFPGDEGTSAFQISGAGITLSNLHFRLELGDSLTSATSSSYGLFELMNVPSTVIDRCSLTIVNADVNGNRYYDSVDFVSLESKPPTVASPTRDLFAKPSIRLSNCVVRGEASLLTMPNSTPFTFSFDNGLFVSDQKMFELGPVGIDSQNGTEIEIYLSRVTSVTQSSPIVTDAGISATFLPVRLDLRQCLFYYRNDSSLVSHQNMPTRFSANQALMIKSVDSFFPHQANLWSVQFQDNQVETLQYKLSSSEEWLQMTGVPGDTSKVNWKRFSDFSIPAHEHSVDDYQLLGKWETNPALRKKAGLNPDDFPAIPVSGSEAP